MRDGVKTLDLTHHSMKSVAGKEYRGNHGKFIIRKPTHQMMRVPMANK
jgi:hypothetical protein